MMRNMFFKYVFNLLVICTCANLMYVQVVNADTVNHSLTIFEDTDIRVVDKKMFGMSFSWGMALEPFLNTDLSVNEEAVGSIRGYPIINSRMAGVDSRTFRWKNALGPYDERVPTSIGYDMTKQKVGVAEWINIVKAIDNNADFTFCLNLENDTASNAADLAEFLTGDGIVNYNGGENWALKRIEFGIAGPVQVLWELGNEMDYMFPSVIGVFSAEDYVKIAEKYIYAIRKVDPSAKFAACGSIQTGVRPELSSDWNRYVLQELGDDIDYITVHAYYDIGSMISRAERMDTIKKDILEVTGEDRIKVAYTEHATSTYGAQAAQRPHTLYGALSTAEFFNRVMIRPEIATCNYHRFTGPQAGACFYQDAKGVFKPTVIADLLKMYAEYGVGTVVKSSLEGYKSSPDDPWGITDIVVKNGDNINIFLCNQTEDSVNVSVESQNNYTINSVTTISGSSRDVSNWYSYLFPDEPETREINIVYDDSYSTDEQFKNYTFSPFSVTVVELRKTN